MSNAKTYYTAYVTPISVLLLVLFILIILILKSHCNGHLLRSGSRDNGSVNHHHSNGLNGHVGPETEPFIYTWQVRSGHFSLHPFLKHKYIVYARRVQ